MKAVSAQAVSCCVHVKPPKIMQHIHNIIPYMFGYWANLVLLKSSMAGLIYPKGSFRPVAGHWEFAVDCSVAEIENFPSPYAYRNAKVHCRSQQIRIVV